MIYITGDMHNDFRRISNKNLKKNNIPLSEEDYLIVCGDFGLCWARDRTFEWGCNWFAQTKFTTLWVQGNHENYDMIAEYPLKEWHGGKVRHIVRDKVILLERGQIFNIEGKSFFTFGGASSHDTQGGLLDRNDPDFDFCLKYARNNWLPYRIIGESWWAQELPSEDEMQEGLNNLKAVDYKVDYVITHCCASNLQHLIKPNYKNDVLTDYFQQLEERLDYKHWFFGHYHEDATDEENRHTVVYKRILPIEEVD